MEAHGPVFQAGPVQVEGHPLLNLCKKKKHLSISCHTYSRDLCVRKMPFQVDLGDLQCVPRHHETPHPVKC